MDILKNATTENQNNGLAPLPGQLHHEMIQFDNVSGRHFKIEWSPYSVFSPVTNKRFM